MNQTCHLCDGLMTLSRTVILAYLFVFQSITLSKQKPLYGYVDVLRIKTSIIRTKINRNKLLKLRKLFNAFSKPDLDYFIFLYRLNLNERTFDDDQ